MAQDTDKAANATEAAAKAGERLAAYAANTTEAVAKTGEKVAAYAANTTEAAAKAGEKIAAETADRIESASKAYSAAIGAAFKAAQDCNTKLVQAFQTNAEANLRLGQALMQTRSPADFVETMGKSVRERTDLVTEQAKELAALGQETARRAIEAIAPGR
jgi:hypothetical protein